MKMLTLLTLSYLLAATSCQASVTIIGGESVTDARVEKVEYGTMFDGGLTIWAQGYSDGWIQIEKSVLKELGLDALALGRMIARDEVEVTIKLKPRQVLAESVRISFRLK